MKRMAEKSKHERLRRAFWLWAMVVIIVAYFLSYVASLYFREPAANLNYFYYGLTETADRQVYLFFYPLYRLHKALQLPEFIPYYQDRPDLDSSGSTFWSASTHTSDPLPFFDPRPGPINALVISPDGRHALDGGELGSLCLWDIKTRRPVYYFGGAARAITAVAFSPDGRLALSGGVDKAVHLWDVRTGQQLHCFEGHTDTVQAVAFTPNGKQAISCGDQSARIWNVETGALDRRIDLGTNIYGVTVSADGEKLLCTCGDGAELRDFNTGRMLRQFKAPNYVPAAAFSPDGKTVLIGLADGGVQSCNAEDGRPTRKFTRRPHGDTDGPFVVTFSPDGRFVLAGIGSMEGAPDFDNSVIVWDAQTGEQRARYAQQGGVAAIAFLPDGDHFLCAGGFFGIYRYALPDRK